MSALKVIPDKNVCISVFLLALLPLVSSCAGNREARTMEAARRISVVTRTAPEFRPAPDASLVWYSDIIVQDQGAAVRVTPEQLAVIKQTIDSRLTGKGYRFSSSPDEADFMLAAALVMDQSAESQNINQLVELYPGLANSFNDLLAGTLLVVITRPTDPRTAPLMWRGAAQAYAMGETLPADVRLSRLQGYTARLINEVPAAGDRD